MTSNTSLEESSIKYDSSHNPSPPPKSLQTPVSQTVNAYLTQSAKRKASVECVEGDEKRQRIEHVSQHQPPAHNIPQASIEDDDFAKMLAAATNQALGTGITHRNPPSVNSLAYAPLTQHNGFPPHVQYRPQEKREKNYWHDPHTYTKIMSLPILENSVIPVLGAFAQNTYIQAVNIQAQPDTELGKAFEAQKALFIQTKKLYSQDAPFLSADELNIFEPGHRTKIRLANLATFITSVFGSQEVGFYELNDNFASIFAPEGEPLQQEPAKLFLNLKTQMFLTYLSQEEQEKTKEEVLEELFPTTYDRVLLARHPDRPLSASEIEFQEQMAIRREYLRLETTDLESLSSLSEKFAWEDFLRRLREHLKNAYEESVIEPYMRKHALTLPEPKPRPVVDLSLDFLEEATLMASQAALQTVNHRPPQQNSADISSQAGLIPYPTQTAPTQVLYEAARQASIIKSAPHTRRPSLPSQRRPWSAEEENALMAGLDAVKGPHWSQILGLYGTGGSISEVLKERNQVQLKDKARNLKLFFLKGNIEVPYYLQSVTGELKTRAPSQVAEREAEGGAEGDDELYESDIESMTPENEELEGEDHITDRS